MFFTDSFISVLFMLVLLLLSVAFLTLLERKVLSLTQYRKGPTKVGVWGLLQPFADGLKLFSKEEVNLMNMSSALFILAPGFGFMVILVLWFIVYSWSGMIDVSYSFLYFMCCVGASVYGLIFSGWASSSKYAMLGALRAVAQTVSYELVLAFLLYLFIYCFGAYAIGLYYMQVNMALVFFLTFSLLLLLMITCIVETNRAPFDLAEGESELVSGFNVEFGGLKFALIFLGEYASILWMSLFLAYIFGSRLIFLFFVLVFLYFRSSYPRIRYDFVMLMLWKGFMFLMLFMYLFCLSL